MNKEPSADWPEDVKKAYEHLKIPTLYDAVLANEKLSLEIRRQDRELKIISEGVQHIAMQMAAFLNGMEGDEEDVFREVVADSLPNQSDEERTINLSDLEIELLEENQILLEQESEDMLMDTHDEIRELSRMARQTIQQVLGMIPKTEGIISRKPLWYSISEQILQNLVEAVDKSRYQLLTRLGQMDIKQIELPVGDPVNPSFHNIIDRVAGGNEETIARVIRVGYIQNEEVLRLADVAVYGPGS